jgi:hemerythrin-like metal-binding protein
VGNDLIDGQHQKLVEIINRLFDGISKKDPNLKMQEIFDELVAYTRYHFNAEEELMTRTSNPWLIEHKKAHLDFINKITSLKVSSIAADEKLKMEVFKFLKIWLTGHIMNMDKNTFSTES